MLISQQETHPKPIQHKAQKKLHENKLMSIGNTESDSNWVPQVTQGLLLIGIQTVFWKVFFHQIYFYMHGNSFPMILSFSKAKKFYLT